MRKFIALLLAPSLLFALAACGTNNTVSETDIPSSSQVSSTNSEDASSNSTDSSEISSDTTSTDDSSDVNLGSSKPSSSTKTQNDKNKMIEENIENNTEMKVIENEEENRRKPGIKRGFALLESEKAAVIADYENKDPVTGKYMLKKVYYESC